MGGGFERGRILTAAPLIVNVSKKGLGPPGTPELQSSMFSIIETTKHLVEGFALK